MIHHVSSISLRPLLSFTRVSFISRGFKHHLRFEVSLLRRCSGNLATPLAETCLFFGNILHVCLLWFSGWNPTTFLLTFQYFCSPNPTSTKESPPIRSYPTGPTWSARRVRFGPTPSPGVRKAWEKFGPWAGNQFGW